MPPGYTADQLDRAVIDMKAALAAMTEGKKDELKKLKGQFYMKFYRLAHVVTFVPRAAGDVRVNLQTGGIQVMLREFTQDGNKFTEIGRAAAKWLTLPKRASDGVLLAGTVKSQAKKDSLYEVQVALPGDSTVTVVSDKDPKLAADSRVIVLGSIVEKPAEKIIGYAGDQPLVVWSGMILSPPDDPSK